MADRPPGPAPAAPPKPAAPFSWRELAVARSLDTARERAESRVQRILDSARELTGDGAGHEFTVQDVVDRSGLSLRTFYRHFTGKHELLLALFEESLRSTAEHLLDRIGETDDPVERLRLFVVEYHRLCQPPEGGAAPGPPAPLVMTEFAQQLLTAHPKEAVRAFAALAALFEGLLVDARAAGAVRAELCTRRMANIILQAVMCSAFATAVGDTEPVDERDAAGLVWTLVLGGLAAPC